MADARKNKGGRPRKEIDMDMLRRLCEIQCTAEECAAVLGVSADTIDRRLRESAGVGFAEWRKQHADQGRMSLRRAQFRAAVEGGNTTMLIWLGKQYLGQRDRHEVEHDGAMRLEWRVGEQVLKITETTDTTEGAK